jgi:HAD superfamily hydrolase (TIGR01490 family)
MNRQDDRPLAVFDLDGTLFRGDSLLPFLLGFAWRKQRWHALLAMPLVLALYLVRVIGDRRAKEMLLVLFLRGTQRSDIAAYARQFVSRWQARRVIPESLARLQQHLEAGHRVILLSASPDLYVAEFARQLGIREVVSTQVRWEGEVCTGEIVGPNCKGEAKLQMLRAYLGRDECLPDSYGYGDRSSDLPVLRWVRAGYLWRDGVMRAVRDLDEPIRSSE